MGWRTFCVPNPARRFELDTCLDRYPIRQSALRGKPSPRRNYISIRQKISFSYGLQADEAPILRLLQMLPCNSLELSSLSLGFLLLIRVYSYVLDRLPISRTVFMLSLDTARYSSPLSSSCFLFLGEFDCTMLERCPKNASSRLKRYGTSSRTVCIHDKASTRVMEGGGDVSRDGRRLKALKDAGEVRCLEIHFLQFINPFAQIFSDSKDAQMMHLELTRRMRRKPDTDDRVRVTKGVEPGP
jgi:hypothetical protein